MMEQDKIYEVLENSNLKEDFDKIFNDVMNEFNIDNWYDLLESDKMSIVEDRIAEKFGSDIFSTEDYIAWYDLMCWEL